MNLDNRQKYVLRTLVTRLGKMSQKETSEKIWNIIAKILSEETDKQVKAFDCLSQLIDKLGDENKEVIFLMGFCFYNGIGTNQDFEEAKVLFEKIKTEDHLAQTALGNMVYFGLGVKEDKVIAKRWYQAAKDQGNAEALYLLGWMHAQGQGGLIQDQKKALEYFELAAQAEYSEAAYDLGGLYEQGNWVEKNLNTAFNWYKIAADLGHAKSNLALGLMYDQGRGVNQDKKQAFFYCRRAAELGDIDAQCNLGVGYALNLGEKQNYNLAFTSFQKASEQENAAALSNLATLYWMGRGVNKDPNKAAELYQRAVELGDNAEVNRKVLREYRENADLFPRIESKEFEKRAQNIPKTQRLSIHGGKIDSEGMDKILKILEKHLELETLDLNGCQLQDLEVQKIARALAPKSFGNNSTLKTLLLSGCEIDDKGAMELANMLKINTDLQCLTLNGNKITSKGIAALAKGIGQNPKSNLQSLWVMDNKVDRDTFDGLVKSLEKNQSLRVLALGGKNSAQPLIFGGMKKTYPTIVKIKQGINMPFINLWTQSYLEGIASKLHLRLSEQDTKKKENLNQDLKLFLKFNSKELKKGQESEYIKQAKKSFELAMKALENTWNHSKQDQLKYQRIICKKVIACSKLLPITDAINFLASLSNIDCWWMTEVQFVLAGLHQENRSDSLYLEKAVNYYEKAARNVLLKDTVEQQIKLIRHELKLKKEIEEGFENLSKLAALTKIDLVQMGNPAYFEKCRRVYKILVEKLEQLKTLKANEEETKNRIQQLEQSISVCVSVLKNIEDFEVNSVELLTILVKEPAPKHFELLSVMLQEAENRLKSLNLKKQQKKEAEEDKIRQAKVEEETQKSKDREAQERLIKVQEDYTKILEKKLTADQEQIKLDQERNNLTKETNKLTEKKNKLTNKSNELHKTSNQLSKSEVAAIHKNSEAIEGNSKSIDKNSEAIHKQTEILLEQLRFSKEKQEQLEKCSETLRKENQMKFEEINREWNEYKKSLAEDQNNFKEEWGIDLQSFQDKLNESADYFQELALKVNKKLKILEVELAKGKIDENELVKIKSAQDFLLNQYKIEQEIIKQQKDREDKQNSELKKIQEHVYAHCFCRVLRLRLHALFHGYQTLASGKVKREEDTLKDKIASVVKTVVGVVPLPGASEFAGFLSGKITESADKDVQHLSEKITELALNHAKDNYIEETARGLTLRYIEQLQCLTLKSAGRQAEIALEYIKDFISSSTPEALGNLAKENTLSQCLMDAVISQDIKLRMLEGVLRGKEDLEKNPERLASEKNQVLDTIKINNRQWKYSGMFKHSGIKILNKSDGFDYYSFNGCKAEKYGYRILTLQELKRAKKRDSSIYFDCKMTELMAAQQKFSVTLSILKPSTAKPSAPALIFSPRASFSGQPPTSPRSSIGGNSLIIQQLLKS